MIAKRDKYLKVIPHIIHCCWFGGNKTPLALKCRESWERILTQKSRDAEGNRWQIREWTAQDIENCGLVIPSFVREAISRQKWAFAADWVRFVALYLEGGVYFDYDFELLKPIDDLAAQGEFVSGEWHHDGSIGMAPGMIALEKESPIAKAMLDAYADLPFDGTTTVGEILANVVHASGRKLNVLAPEILCPIDSCGICRQTAETRGIHHYAMSWASPKRRFAKWLSWHGCRKVVECLLKVRNLMFKRRGYA